MREQVGGSSSELLQLSSQLTQLGIEVKVKPTTDATEIEAEPLDEEEQIQQEVGPSFSTDKGWIKAESWR